MTTKSFEVKVNGGTLIAQQSFDPENPGISICYRRDGENFLNDVCLVENTDIKLGDTERATDIRVLVWGDPDDEDYTDSMTVDFGSKNVKITIYADELTKTYLGIKPPTETFEKLFGGNSAEIEVPEEYVKIWAKEKYPNLTYEEFLEEYTSDDMDGFLQRFDLKAKDIGAYKYLEVFNN